MQTTGATAVAWWVARMLLPEPRPVFAPLAAIVALSATRGERGTRALQVSLGVVVGISAAELIVRPLGTGTLVLALVTGLALVAAVFLFEASTFVIQAGVSAALVVTVGASPKLVGVDRLFEALVGGGVALVISQVLFPSDAVAKVSDGVAVVLTRLADGLDGLARALRTAGGEERAAAQASLRRARLRIVDLQDELRFALQATRVSRPRRNRRSRLARFDGIDVGLESTVSSAETLVLTSAQLGQGHELAAALAEALDGLADLARELAADIDPSPDTLGERARVAAAHAATGPRSEPDSVVATLVTLVRSITHGLLHIGGMDTVTADQALGRVVETTD